LSEKTPEQEEYRGGDQQAPECDGVRADIDKFDDQTAQAEDDAADD